MWCAGCFAPNAQQGAACKPAAGNCPSGQVCTASGDGFYCLRNGVVDAPAGSGDAPMLTDGPSNFCYGTGLVQGVCFTQALTDTFTFANRTINTATVGGNDCTLISPQAGGPSLCIIAGRTITIQSGATLSSSGPNPLVLIASETLSIEGTLDVASHRGGTTGAAAQSTCGTGLDGASGMMDPQGGGGAAGGTFGGAGGNGGQGRANVSGGTARSPGSITLLVGGCPGGRGGQGGTGGDGAGGSGGGAVYLIAGASLTIAGAGKVNASGAGGGAGGTGVNASGGAGGGGSGGLIGLDAPAIAITGSVFANGGGGGGGGGDGPDQNGQPGADPSVAGVAASGGNGGNGGGGRGGNGSVAITNPQAGSNGTGLFCGGGGGGGGRGVVRVFQVAPGSLGGTISPPPS